MDLSQIYKIKMQNELDIKVISATTKHKMISHTQPKLLLTTKDTQKLMVEFTNVRNNPVILGYTWIWINNSKEDMDCSSLS